MTLERIAELRSQKGKALTLEEFSELFDAAEAVELMQWAGQRWAAASAGTRPLAWCCTPQGDCMCSVFSANYEYPTPQAAVLAALKPKV